MKKEIRSVRQLADVVLHLARNLWRIAIILRDHKDGFVEHGECARWVPEIPEDAVEGVLYGRIVHDEDHLRLKFRLNDEEMDVDLSSVEAIRVSELALMMMADRLIRGGRKTTDEGHHDPA